MFLIGAGARMRAAIAQMLRRGKCGSDAAAVLCTLIRLRYPAQMLRSLLPDRFILLLMGTVAAASLVPARGTALDLVGSVSTLAIMLLFFFHGLRISPAAVLAGVRHWRLQIAIGAFGYLLMPILGAGLAIAATPLVGAGLAAGFIFLSVLPTTVQSAIAYSSIARGNVAAAVIASALSNVEGVLLTPLLFAAIAQVGAGGFGMDGISRIAAILLLPFVAGQVARRWLATVAERNRAIIGRLDRLTILLAVYVAFSEAVSGGIWRQVDGATLAALVGLTLLLLLIAFTGAWLLGGLLRLPVADRATLLFAGAHKSLATGAPMARILFPGAEAGAILLPLLLYHQLQLMLSAVLATRIAARSSTDDDASSPKRA